jgi:AcrR family transcriptional regulator
MEKALSQARRSPITDTRMRRTRKALRDALLELLQRKRIDQLTIRDIAAEADIGYATFFRHYASKEQLLEEIAAEEIARLTELTVPLLSPSDTRVSCLALCNYVHAHRVLWSALLTGGAAGTLREEFIRLVQQPRTRSIPRPRWLPTELGAVFGVGATIEIIGWWLQRPDELTPKQVANILSRLVVAPVIDAK